ncbi:MAG: methionyl-tRNA formyltransferase [Pseudomonadota bacterium]
MSSDKKLKIIFMGSAGFAVPSLDALIRSHHKIIEVVAQPDKPAGRGQHVKACPVAAYAREHDLTLFQPTSVKKTESIEHFEKLGCDLLIIVAYGKLLPAKLLELPPMGCINVHASLLPKYRGAAPINWAIANGEKETGVTTMFISEELDAGDVLLCASTPLDEAETATELHDRLSMMGADLLLHTIDGLIDGTLKPKPQDHSKATYAPLIKKEDGHIDWSKSTAEIYNRIRAFTPWPGSFALVGTKKLTIHEAEPMDLDHALPPGTVLESKEHILIACGKGALCLVEMQMEGGRRMSASDFLHGHKIKEGEVLT